MLFYLPLQGIIYFFLAFQRHLRIKSAFALLIGINDFFSVFGKIGKFYKILNLKLYKYLNKYELKKNFNTRHMKKASALLKYFNHAIMKKM